MSRRLFSLALSLSILAGCGVSQRNVRPAPSGPQQVTVLFVADLHGQLQPHPELFWHGGEERTEEAGGFARLAAAIADIRREQPGRVLAIDGGDTLQGSGVAALTEGAAIVEPLNALGLDLGIPGNWEVVYGPKVLRERAKAIRHPLLATNMRDAETGERLFAPYAVREVNGVRIAVIGYTDPDVPRRQPPAYSRGLTYTGPEELRELVREVKEQHRADVVLLASHIGLSKAVALAEQVPGVDVHLSSDTHERTYEPIERAGTWVVEPGAFGSFIGRLDLWVDQGKVVDKRWELIELTAARHPEDPAVSALVERSIAPHREKLSQPVGATKHELARYAVVETTLDRVLADALREATGTEIALSNGFRFGTPIPPGTIRENDLWNFFPVVTQVKTGKVSGRQLRAFWEQELENVFSKNPERRFGGWLPRPSGLSLTFVADAPKGQRVRELRVGGQPVEDDRLYTVTACEREGDSPDTLCRIPGAKEPRVLDFDAHEAVRRYLAKHPEIRSTPERRVVGLDLPPVLRTQM